MNCDLDLRNNNEKIIFIISRKNTLDYLSLLSGEK